MRDSLIVIPTYDEKGNITRLIRQIMALEPGFDILVVDDNSPDGTGEIVDSLVEEYKDRVFVMHRAGKLGLGTAYVQAFKWGFEKPYKFFFQMDADFSHDPTELPNFLKAIEHADVVVGSRFYKWRLSVVNWPLKRLILCMLGYRYIKLVLGKTGLYDNTTGFKCFKRKVLETLPLDKIRSTGYAFQIEMNFRTMKKGFKISEIPIIFVDRHVGTSKVSGHIIKEAFMIPLILKLASIFNRKEFL